jgi:hypothetical protein
VPEREASGDFDSLFEDVPDESSVDALPDAQASDLASADDIGPDDIPLEADVDPGTSVHFDAFDSSTWYFEPAPPAWYRTKHTLTVLVVASVAAIALVVSGVLLVFRGGSGTAVDDTTSVTQTAATTTASRPPSRTSAPPPPPSPPPPPPPNSAAPAAPAPAQTNRPRTPSTRTTKEPEIGVTRTPATRSPISVAPQRPRGNQR